MKLPEQAVRSTIRSALGSTGRPPPGRPPRLRTSTSQGIHTSARTAVKDAASLLERAASTISHLSTAAAHTVKTARAPPTLGANFRALLSYCAPIFNNAGSTFLSTPPASARGFQSVGLAFSQSVSRSGSQIAQQAALRTGRLGAGIGRTSRIPVVPRSTAYGPGLQTARSFSTGGAAGSFVSVVNNVPLVLRALGNELDDGTKKTTHGAGKGARASRSTPRRMTKNMQAKLAREEVRRVVGTRSVALGEVQTSAAKATTASTAAAAASKADEMSSSEVKEGIAEYFAPSITTAIASSANSLPRGPHVGVTTTLNVALDPDLRTILCATTLGTAELGIGVGDAVLDATFSAALQSTRKAYAEHAVLLSALLEALGKDTIIASVRAAKGYDESASLMLRALSDQELLRNVHAMALRVEFDGWAAHEVREMLDERLGNDLGAKLARGNSGGCSLREVRVGGDTYGETYLAYPQLDMSAIVPEAQPSLSPQPSLAMSLDSISLPSTPSSTMSELDLLWFDDGEGEGSEMDDDDLQDSRLF